MIRQRNAPTKRQVEVRCAIYRDGFSLDICGVSGRGKYSDARNFLDDKTEVDRINHLTRIISSDLKDFLKNQHRKASDYSFTITSERKMGRLYGSV